jgi:hypothetical protein
MLGAEAKNIARWKLSVRIGLARLERGHLYGTLRGAVSSQRIGYYTAIYSPQYGHIWPRGYKSDQSCVSLRIISYYTQVMAGKNQYDAF